MSAEAISSAVGLSVRRHLLNTKFKSVDLRDLTGGDFAITPHAAGEELAAFLASLGREKR